MNFTGKVYQHLEHCLQKLLNEDNETYYWIGFIMADGCISRNKTLSLGLAIQDEEHTGKYHGLKNNSRDN